MINSSANATTRNGKVQLNNNGEGLFGDEMVNQDKVTRNGWPAVQVKVKKYIGFINASVDFL